MAYKTPTPNLGLIEPQPGTGEKIRLSDINTNWDTLDARIGAVPSTTNLQAQITALAGDTSAKAKVLSLTSSDNTWAKVWAKISTIPIGGSALAYFHNTAYGVFSNGARSAGYPSGTITRPNESQFDALFTTTNHSVISVLLTSASSSSAGNYSENLIGEYADADSVSSESALFTLLDAKLATMSNYEESKFNVSLTAAVPPFVSGARLMITLSRGASATFAMAIIQQAGSEIVASAGKSSTWTMHEILRQGVLKQQEFTVPKKADNVNGTRVVTDNESMTVYMFVSFYNHVESWAGMWMVMFGSSSSLPTVKEIYGSSKISVEATAARQVTFSNTDTSYEGHVTAVRVAGTGEITLT